MRRLALVLTAAASLSACTTVVSDTCPTLFDYSAELQARAARELAALPPDAALAKLVGDYGVVRNEIRVCQDER